MSYLQFYQEERKLFSVSYQLMLRQEEIIHAFNKLKKHYKLNTILILRGQDSERGRFRFSKTFPLATTKVRIGKKSCFGTLIHEVAHAIEFQKHHKTRHAKRLMKIIRAVTSYCKRRNWLGIGEQKAETSFIVEEGRELECLIPEVIQSG